MADIPICADSVPGSWTTANSIGGREYGGIAFFLVDLIFSTPIYLSGTEKNVFYNSNSYAPFPFVVENIKNTAGPTPMSLRLSASNLDRSISTAILGEVVQGKEAIVRKAYWYTTNPTTHTDPYIYFRGMIDAVNITEEENTARVEFEVKNDFVRWDKQIPPNQFSATCNWIFKSTTPGCQYTGVESICDRSWSRCSALQNTERFRGCHYMTTIEDKEIWWGALKQSSSP